MQKTLYAVRPAAGSDPSHLCVRCSEKVKQTALILSSGDAFVYGPAITQYYQSIVEYWGVKNAGIFTANGEKNKSEEKRQELYAFGKT